MKKGHWIIAIIVLTLGIDRSWAQAVPGGGGQQGGGQQGGGQQGGGQQGGGQQGGSSRATTPGRN